MSALASDEDGLGRQLRQEAIAGRVGRIESLIKEGAPVDAAAPYGETALYYAIQFGHTKAARRLLELGANPNVKDDLDRSPILKAAEDCNFRVVQSLLAKSADINHADHYGRTALINAVEGGCLRTVAVLLSQRKPRVRLNAHDGNNRTALEYARHPWIEKMLEAAGAKSFEMPKVSATLW